MLRYLLSLFFILFSFSSLTLYASLKDVQQRLYSMSPKEELISPKHKLWVEDFDEGLKLAKAENKPLLIAFVGLPWCPWSEKMETEVLSKQAFVGPLRKEYILITLNLSEEEESCNELKAQYGVEELPTLVVTNSEGKEITKVGFLPKTPEEFAAYLRKVKSDYSEVSKVVEREDLFLFTAEELQRLYLKAKKQGFDSLKEKLYLAGLQLDKGLFFLLEQYRSFAEKGKQGTREGEALRKKIFLRDPGNKEGAFRCIALLDFESLAAKRSKKKKHIKAALKPIIEYVKKFGKEDTENLWRMELLVSQFLYGKNKAKDALLHAKSAYNHAPEENKAEIVDTITYLETKVKKG